MDPEPPRGVDVSRPSVARMYDFYLGGTHNYPSDRAAVYAIVEAYSKTPEVISEARHFLRRAVRYMCFEGIDQFIDMGSGLPSADNTHQVAQRVNPNARVVYVDIDDVAVAFGQQMLDGDSKTAFIKGSVLELQPILNHPETRKLIDFSKPVGVLMMGLLHFFSLDTDRAILKDLRDNLAPGSLLSFTHTISNHVSEEEVQQVSKQYAKTPTPIIIRDKNVVEEITQGYTVVEPGVVLMFKWRPDLAEEGKPESPQTSIMIGAVLRT
ncbi:S-adenosyl-L-methionine dependent methyltransferase [Trichoderma austrokoningii]